MLGVDDFWRIVHLIHRAGLPIRIRLSRRQRDHLLAAMKLDKKVGEGEIKFVLAERIGQVLWGAPIPPALIEQVLMPAKLV